MTLPVWGDPQSLNAALPWFIMAGRNDARQKGFDVAAAACREYLARGGHAQSIFCPLITKEHLEQLDYLRTLANEHPQHVIVFAGFCPNLAAFRQGADLGLMPSLYEPFGMANEYYLDGVPVVARATGGITQQVIPFLAGAAYSDAVRQRTTPSSTPTGILYREPDNISTDAAQWRCLNNANNDPARWHDSALYHAMTKELTLALLDAEHLTTMPHLYADLAIAGALHIQRRFSWYKNKAAYDRLIDSDLRAA